MQHGPQEKPVLNAWFLFRNYDNTNPTRRKTRCDSDSSRSGKSKRKARSSLSAEVQALADTEQELYFTRLQVAEFL